MKSHLNLYNRIKVAFIQKILMRFTYTQIDEPNYFHELDILNWIIKGTEISLEIEDVLTFDTSENCKGKNAALGALHLAVTCAKNTKNSISDLSYHFRTLRGPVPRYPKVQKVKPDLT